ncbi:MAG: MotA/TolQ/ExbB proton channel family protein [Pseudomonadota bacterium]|nr:MotA/TolQ/ExbB proton channel family protein [Pseudomonadota bacterium]
MLSSLQNLLEAMPWTVQILGAILIAMSVMSWTMIIQKYRSFYAMMRQYKEFEKVFWSGGDLEALYDTMSSRRKENPISAIFCTGYDTLTENQGEQAEAERQIGQAKDAMQIQMKKWELTIHNDLTWLATIASISPYLGLLGTVFGVMHTFQGLLNTETQASLQAVAPGISEALGMTALGLVVAIPATVAFNRFTVWMDDLINYFQLFQDEFTLLLAKQYK